MSISGRRGVTLLELLVAMTLFSLLSAAVLYSLRVGIRTLERTRERSLAARRYEGAERALERMLAGIVNVPAEFVGPPSPQPITALFFQGEPSVMRFTTIYSLEEGYRGNSYIVELAVLPREDGGGLRLIANEIAYYGPSSAGALISGRGIDPVDGQLTLLFRPVAAGTRSFVLADRLSACRFLFLDTGTPSNPDPWVLRWKPNYALPRAIRVEMGLDRAVTSRVYVSNLQ